MFQLSGRLVDQGTILVGGNVNDIEWISYSRSLTGICNLNVVELERVRDIRDR